MRRIILSLLLITGTVGALAYGATSAFFSDTETSSANVFTAGAIDLKIDNESFYNGVANSATSWELTDLTASEKFFDFLDLKPDDYGEDTISIHVDTNDAYLCANVTLTSDVDNDCTEPEEATSDACTVAIPEGTTPGSGELAGLVNFIWWADDGDNVLETNETAISPIGPIGALTLNDPFLLTLADSDDNIWTGTGGPILGDTDYFIGKAWCFGTLTAAPLPPSTYSGPDQDNDLVNGAGKPEDGGITCDGTLLGNESQTDSLTADISFNAVQSRHNPSFQCEETPVFEACSAGQQYADANGLFDQGRQKEGDPVLANRSAPSAAFGVPQTTGSLIDVGFPVGSFVSLGFVGTSTATASLVLTFTDNVVLNGVGPDIKVYEVTGGVYPDEHVKVEISQNGTTWFVAAADVTRDASVDIAGTGLTWAKYVRLTDINSTAGFPADADGYDVDALEALNCAVPVT